MTDQKALEKLEQMIEKKRRNEEENHLSKTYESFQKAELEKNTSLLSLDSIQSPSSAFTTTNE